MNENLKEHYNKKYDDWGLADKKLVKALKDDKIVLSELLKRCNFSKTQHVLELGCGVGYKSHILSEFLDNVTAVDLSEVAINKARQWWNKNINFICADFLIFPLEQKFDIVYASSFSLLKNEFKKSEYDILSRIFSLLKKGGYFIFEWGRNSKYEEKYNGWGYITLSDVKKVFPKFGIVEYIYANHRQLASLLNKFYFSKLFTYITIYMSKFHNQGYRLYVIIKKS